MIDGFRIPTRVQVVPGCFQRLGEVVEELAGSSAAVCLVVDPGIVKAGLAEWAESRLAERGIRTVVFDRVEPNPRTTTALAIGVLMREEGLCVAVGLGGGSVLDAAKAGAMLATNPGDDIAPFVGKNRFAEPPLPFVAVPTTCGTGSEVTWVSVLSDVANKTKVSVKGDAMFPDVALVDPDLLSGLPPALIASTGMDALTHAVEALTANCGNPVSDALATAAIEEVFAWLPQCVEDPKNAEARFGMARASCLAGLAFGNADVGGVHCLSESIGGIFDLPHGLLNAVLLPPVMRSHRPAVDSRLARLEARLGGGAQDSVEERAGRFIGRMEALGAKVGIPAFAELDVPRDAFDAIAEASVQNGSNASNPRSMSKDDYLAILNDLVG